MAKEEKQNKEKQSKEKIKLENLEKKSEEPQKKRSVFHEDKQEELLIRIAGYDIPGNKKLLPGLTRIKGVGWAISNAVCLKLSFDKGKKISELSKDEIKKIETFLKNPDVLDFMKNRRKDLETGKTGHFIGTDLDIKKDFDIRRLKKIRSYKGIRHNAGLPVRGQRTRSHFRKKGQAVRVRKK